MPYYGEPLAVFVLLALTVLLCLKNFLSQDFYLWLVPLIATVLLVWESFMELGAVIRTGTSVESHYFSIAVAAWSAAVFLWKQYLVHRKGFEDDEASLSTQQLTPSPHQHRKKAEKFPPVRTSTPAVRAYSDGWIDLFTS